MVEILINIWVVGGVLSPNEIRNVYVFFLGKLGIDMTHYMCLFSFPFCFLFFFLADQSFSLAVSDLAFNGADILSKAES